MANPITISNTSLAQSLIGKIGNSQATTASSLSKLSTGLLVSKASDNAAALSIISGMNSEVRGLNQATRNTNDAISMTQIADGGMQSINEAQQRIRELSVQASNGTLNDSDRASLQLEVDQLQSQISDTIANTEFNGKQVLASSETVAVQTGPNAGDSTNIALTDYSASFTNVDISTQAGAQSAITSIDADMETATDAQAKFGAVQNGLESTASNLASMAESISAARSRIEDLDVASETAKLASSQIRDQFSVSTLAQSGQYNRNILDLL
ncbi:MAG: flagellin [Magnetococcales bacterium]|nr:flagellin [Magnetococcales bacterium]